MENQATLEEIVKLELDYSRGFYAIIDSGYGIVGRLHAGRNPDYTLEVF